MIQLPNGGRIVETVDELPNLLGCRDIFLDYETTSRDPKRKATNPWDKCNDVAGIAVTADDCQGAWYLPVNHKADLFGNHNLPRESVVAWLRAIRQRRPRWINHNVKFDAHVEYNLLGVDMSLDTELVCTATMGKLLDSDRMFTGGYGLDALSGDWLGHNISMYERRLKEALGKSKDYGEVAPDICGEYACEDVLTNRRLFHYIEQMMPAESQGTATIERRVTSVLLEIERRGLRVKPLNLKIEEFKCLNLMLKIDEKLTELTGRAFRPHVNDDCFDVLCNQYGLPVLAWTEENDDGTPAGGPSFDKYALRKYLAHPLAPREVVELIIAYRKLNTRLTFFLGPMQELQVDGRLHPDYNQRVQTGRLSCKNPNAQQFDIDAKELILPDDGKVITSHDYSQIEFRLIAHYINDPEVIRAYAENPDADFHVLVAEWCGVKRRPAKTLNFLMGYGGGRKKATKTLSLDMDLVGSIREEVLKLRAAGKVSEGQEQAVFELLAAKRADWAYDKYHDTLPTLKPTSRRACRVAEERGYVKNIYGARRRLTKSNAYKAFNSVCQASAAELMKRRMVAAHDLCRSNDWDYEMLAQVHDDLVGQAPPELFEDPTVRRAFAECLEEAEVPLRVPIRVNFKSSPVSWGKCE